MKNFLSLLLFVGLAGCASAPVAVAPPDNAELANCAAGEDHRVLEVERLPAGCSLFYTKAGKRDRVVASGSGPQECLNRLKTIRSALREAGFTCN